MYQRIAPLLIPFCLPLPHSSSPVFRTIQGWALEFHTKLKKPPTDALRPVIPDNAWGPRITAAAGTKFAAPLFLLYRHYLPREKKFTPTKASSFTRCRSIRLSPIVEDSSLLPPVGVWAVSQSHCGWPSSQTSYPSLPWWAITSPTSW